MGVHFKGIIYENIGKYETASQIRLKICDNCETADLCCVTTLIVYFFKSPSLMLRFFFPKYHGEKERRNVKKYG